MWLYITDYSANGLIICIGKHSAIERFSPAQQFVQQNPEGIDIGSSVDVRAAGGLFGAHGFVCTDRLAGTRIKCVVCEAVAGKSLGDAKVNGLGGQSSIDEAAQHIRYLQIAMNDRLGVGVSYGVAHLCE